MIAAHLDGFRTHLLRSSLYRKWRAANPGEDAAVWRYWDGGTRPTTVRSEFGLALLSAADAYAESTTVPPPIVDLGMPYPVAPITT